MFQKLPSLLYLSFLCMTALGLIIPATCSTVSHSTNETDRLPLLAIKSSIVADPFGVLMTWNNSLHFCNWYGVTCGRLHQRVTELNLSSMSLVGSVSPHVGNLTFLRSLVLSGNNLRGSIPEEIGRLFRLQVLSLRNNSFEGEFPANLTGCSNLMYLDTHSNQLVGEIPINLRYLSKLVEMSLGRNSFSGTIPTSFGNLSSLLKLSIEENILRGGIPFELGQLSRLESISLGFNDISGIVPPALFNISSIDTFSVTVNRLHGTLPTVTLPNLKRFDISTNEFYGPLPTSIANASGMVVMDIESNAFVGPLPKDLGRLYNLQRLRASANSFGTNASNELLNIFTSLSNCSNLGWLDLRENHFKDSLPSSVANLSTTLNRLWLDKNYISGSIPPEIGNLVSLTSLGLAENMLTGRIPDSIGRLAKLVQLYIHSNNISGNVPYTFGNLTLLSIFNASNNMLEENIPVSLGNCRNLQLIDLARNHLTGHIPDQLFTLSSISISLSQNYLTGNLPVQIGYSINLGVLQVSDNKLSGRIPSALGDCVALEILYLQGNLFEGDISVSFVFLRGIQALDLSRNKFSGKITFLGEFIFIEYLNLSYNNFEGEVPNAGIFRNISAFSVVKNTKLCGGIKELQLPACPSKVLEKNKPSSSRRVLIALAVTLAITSILVNVSVIIYCLLRRSKQQASLDPPLQNQYTKLSYADLFQATDGFASFNLIGKGRHGSIFQGILSSDEQSVAVKVLNLQQHGAIESFIAECEALRTIRHRNLVKIVTSCSSIDFKGDHFKALVLELMPNGSLEKWLHPTYPDLQEPQDFNLGKRLNIAIDIASALDYLHNHCEVAIIHCDLKPSNVLLDDNFCARVSDFGLARIFSRTYLTSNHQQSSSIGIVGSIGYIAPEYGMGGLLSTRGDMYSYGVLLLEMFTGKRPTNKMFVDSFNLHSFVRMSLPSQVMNVVDPRILLEVEEERKQSGTTNITKAEDCLVSILKIGVSCSADIPRERIDAGNILIELHKIRNAYIS